MEIKVYQKYDLQENGFFHQLVKEHKAILMKHLNSEELNIDEFQNDIMWFYQKFGGEKSQFVRDLITALRTELYEIMFNYNSLNVVDINSKKFTTNFSSDSLWENSIKKMDNFYNGYWEIIKSLNGDSNNMINDAFWDNIISKTDNIIIKGLDAPLSKFTSQMTVGLLCFLEARVKAEERHPFNQMQV